MVYADTSFLLSLVLHDSNTTRAASYLKGHPSSLAFTTWQNCELRNAVRLSVWRGYSSAVDSAAAMSWIDKNIEAGDLEETALVWPELLEIAEELSEKHTASLGVRTLDIMHVAAAASLDAKAFLTFEDRQNTLARAIGLRVPKL